MRNLAGAQADAKKKANFAMGAEPISNDEFFHGECGRVGNDPVLYRKLPGFFLVAIKGYGAIALPRVKGDTIQDVLGV